MRCYHLLTKIWYHRLSTAIPTLTVDLLKRTWPNQALDAITKKKLDYRRRCKAQWAPSILQKKHLSEAPTHEDHHPQSFVHKTLYVAEQACVQYNQACVQSQAQTHIQSVLLYVCLQAWARRSRSLGPLHAPVGARACKCTHSRVPATTCANCLLCLLYKQGVTGIQSSLLKLSSNPK